MNHEKSSPGKILDEGLAAMRNASVAAGQLEDSGSRVLQNVQAQQAKVVLYPPSPDARAVERIRSCEDFRSLIPAYLSSSLTESRKLLFEDHVHECVLCRKVLEQTSGKIAPLSTGPRRLARFQFPVTK